MSVAPLIVEIVTVICAAATLLYKYGNWSKQHIIVTLSVLIAWSFSFIIVIILPLDVSSTTHRQCIKDHEVVVVTTTPSPSTSVTFSSATLITSPTTFASTFPPPDNAFANITIAPGSNVSAEHSASLTLPYAGEEEASPCTEPWSHIPDHVLPILWRVVYWTSQCLTWIILPMMQSYSQAGDFTVLGKLRSALIDNAIYYGSYLCIFIILLIYITFSPNIHLDGPKLKVICVTTSNTWGLFLLVLLLGYGLVEVPRSCWNSAKRGFLLNYCYFKAAKLNVERSEADDSVEDLLEDIQRISASVRPTHTLRKNVDTIISKVPESLVGFLNNRHQNHNEGDNPFECPSERSLVRLHKQFIRALRIQNRSRTQWDMLVDNGIRLEDLARNEVSSERYFKPTFQSSPPVWWRVWYTPTIEWYWKCVVRVWILRILAVVFTVFSVFVVWSEVTFFNKSPVLSLFAIFVDLAKRNYDYFYIELASCCTIAYLCVCAYYTVFKIRVLNFYYLAPHHQTDEYSLIFSGMLLCRLTPPLCLNFLGLVHLDSHITSDHNIVETSYTNIMGHMDVISFISDGFNIYFPIGILILCCANYFRLGSRLLTLIGFQQFIGDDEMTTDLVEEGRELIKREKRKRQRSEDGELKRRQYQDKLSGNAMYRTTRQRQREVEEKSLGFPREDSAESARAELLRDVEPIDYTGEGASQTDVFSNRLSGHPNNPQQFDSANRLYQADGELTSWPPYSTRGRNYSQPPRGIFDDI